MQIKFGLTCGRERKEEVIEFPDDTTGEELDRALDDFISNYVDGWWVIIENED